MRPGQKPPRSGVTLNGITPGPNSPLLTGEGKIRQAPEFSVQAGLVELLVGKIGKGDRLPGNGLTGRFPELLTLYAIPNGGKLSSKTVAARQKAEGMLRGAPDLCLPVARLGWHALYLETKREGAAAGARQREVHRMLEHEGNLVAVYDTVQEGLDIVLAYLGGDRPTLLAVLR